MSSLKYFLKPNTYLNYSIKKFQSFNRYLTTSSIFYNKLKIENNYYNVGSLIEGYRLEKITPVDELNLIAFELNHEKTGTYHIHIAADDPNNAFSVSFKTPVNDDTGVAHILEHMVLCGSKNYPVHDPFFKMSLRSVSTFMNAMTFPDHTTYPFSSVNKKDYKNLLSVYLDCVFNPCLRKSDFLQEAWRLEHEDINNLNSPLIFKGVVFNEMKGALNTQSSVQDLEYTKNLLPTSYYSNSGGNPLNIVELTHEKLIKFHKTFYTPSNSLFITYGDIPMREHLSDINNILLNLEHLKSCDGKKIVLPTEKLWDLPRKAKAIIPYDPLLSANKQSIFMMGFLFKTENYNRDIFLLSVLSQLLLNGPNSPFYKNLLCKNIGSDYCDNVGLSTYTKDPTFAIGLKGINGDDALNIENIIISTLENTAKNGFSEKHILGVIKEIELSIKHIGSTTGINYATGIPTRWAHDYNPSDGLLVKDHLEYIYQHYKDGVFEELIENYFLKNNHRLSLSLNPDIKFSEKLKNEEIALLNRFIINSASNDSMINGEKIIDEPDLVDKILPKITINDLTDSIPHYIAEHNIIGDETPLQTSCQPTNGLAYIRININANSLPSSLQPYLPLFSHIITQIGANELTHEEISELISLNSSPYSANPVTRVSLTNADEYDRGLILSSYCTYNNTVKMMEIWNHIINKPHIKNDDHIKVLISEYIDSKLSSIIDDGHQYAMLRANSYLSYPSEYKELISGLKQAEFVQNLSNLIHINKDSAIDSICEKLLQIASYLFDRSKFSCFVVCEDDYMPQLVSIMNGFISDVPSNFSDPFSSNNDATKEIIKKHMNEFIYIPSSVYYNASSYRIPNFLHPDFPYFKVLSLLLTNKFLIPKIREIGGAYGAGATASDGCFSFYSYRDPNIVSTFENFKNSIEWVMTGEYDMKALNEAKVKAIGDILTPIPPSRRTLSLFRQGITHQHIVNYRDKIQSCQKNDIERISEMYLWEHNDPKSGNLLPLIKSNVTIGENVNEIEMNPSWIINKKLSERQTQ